MRSLLALGLLLFATGRCPAQPLAHVFVYEQREAPLRSRLLLRCDGAAVAKIKRGSFFAMNIPAGRHILSNDKGVPLPFEVQAGDECYVAAGVADRRQRATHPGFG